MRRPALLLAWALFAAACGGHAVVRTEVAQGPAEGPGGASRDGEPAVATGAGKVNVGRGAGGAAGSGGGGSGGGGSGGGGATSSAKRCATTSDPSQGFTEDSITWGTILPLTGALRPLGEQTARVMKVTAETYVNSVDHFTGALSHINWGCPERPGIYGRKVDLKIFSLQASTPEEALAGMRRLIDVENAFLVRDCYLQTSLMGPATQYQNQKGVPAIWCHYNEMPMPQLAPWNFSPGIDPLTQTAIHVGYLFKKLKRQRLAILADPTMQDTNVRIATRIAEHFGHPVPEDCIVLTRSQEAPNGMRSQIARIRTCYGAGRSPDAVLALDALQGVFGALEAEAQGWRPADAGVAWACTVPSCWVESLAEICRDACEGMITDCATLPCVPWADPRKYPSVEGLEDVRKRYLPGEPRDAVTYGPMAITSGITLWLAMTGPDLTRERFRRTVGSLRDWSSGIGPILNTGPDNHFGGRAQWLIRFTGRAPWFDDLSRDFVTVDDVGVPDHLTRL